MLLAIKPTYYIQFTMKIALISGIWVLVLVSRIMLLSLHAYSFTHSRNVVLTKVTASFFCTHYYCSLQF